MKSELLILHDELLMLQTNLQRASRLTSAFQGFESESLTAVIGEAKQTVASALDRTTRLLEEAPLHK